MVLLPVFSVQTLSDEEQKAIDDMMIFRLNTSTYTPEATIKAVEAYLKSFASEVGTKHISEEVQLIIENYLIIEKCSCLEES